MPLDDRTWKPRGLGLIGEAHDGRRAVEITITTTGPGKDLTAKQRRQLVETMLAAHNEYGAPQYTEKQQKILDAIAAHEETSEWGMSVTQIHDATGISPAWIHVQLGELEAAGAISRPPKAGPGRRSRLVRLARPVPA